MSMVSIKRRQLAYKLGSKADTRQFVPFSKTTNGDHGRKVFIDAALAPLFASLIDPNSAKGVQTIMKIEQLRAIAGGVTSNSNVSTWKTLLIWRCITKYTMEWQRQEIAPCRVCILPI